MLDFTASPEQLGKPVLSDLKEGKVTLPLIYALQSAAGDGAAGRRMVKTVLEEKGFETVGRSKLRPWCTSQGRWIERELPRTTLRSVPRPA